jgi:hypothetical protein
LKGLMAAAALALVAPGAASAVTFGGSWGVSGSALSDPGLVVRTSPAGAFSLDLASGESASFNLFRIWSPEADVGSDDLAARGLSVGFELTSHDAGGAISGTTAGHKRRGLQWGSVDWSAPLLLDVGTGVLSVELEDTGFNTGFLSLAKGKPWGSDVRATFSYASPVPLPAGFGLVAAGMAALGLLGFRRRTA